MRTLREAIVADSPIVVGDIVMLELLLGVSNDRLSARIEAMLRTFNLETMLDDDLAVRASKNYRHLRSRGFTLRGTVDLIIGTFCIERGYSLLHNDRDFEPMHTLLGLRRA